MIHYIVKYKYKYKYVVVVMLYKILYTMHIYWQDIKLSICTIRSSQTNSQSESFAKLKMHQKCLQVFVFTNTLLIFMVAVSRIISPSNFLYCISTYRIVRQAIIYQLCSFMLLFIKQYNDSLFLQIIDFINPFNCQVVNILTMKTRYACLEAKP